MSVPPKFICLTPVKNEDWILEPFLKAATHWANHIFVADQNSTDSSVEIAKKFPKVTLVKNSSNTFNEPERQKLLLHAAREITGPKILIALDADEVLIPDAKEWQQIKKLPPGTVIKFPWANIRPEGKRFWFAPQEMPFGFVDDNSTHLGQQIHSTRIPYPETAPVFICKKSRVLHFQYLDWDRMRSKHRWYQAYEVIVRNRRDYASLYRQYHHMDSPGQLQRLPSSWHKLIPQITPQKSYWWDTEVLSWLQQYPDKLKFADVWDFSHPPVADPRRPYHRLFLYFLRRTQNQSNRPLVRLIDQLIDRVIILVYVATSCCFVH